MDDDSKEYRRNKPLQKLYKPGSGPLRRSSYGLDTKMDSYGVDNDTRGRDRSQYGSHSSVNELDVSKGHREISSSGRPRKPEQQLYVPRSADASSDKGSMRGDNSSQFNNRRMSNKQDKHGFNSGTGSYTRGASRRKFPYKDGANNDINYNNRNYRQVSETRSISPTHCAQDQNVDRNRDSRSMETSAGRHLQGAGGKPPSGRRNSAGYPEVGRPKHMVNLDNMPPRFRKKFLEQSGHQSFDNVDQISRDRYFSNHSVQPNLNQNQFYNSNTNWSQTLPSRGRGRLGDNKSFDREKFMSTFLKNYEAQNSRRSTPSNSYMNLYEPHLVDNKNLLDTSSVYSNNTENMKDQDATNNGLTYAQTPNDVVQNQKEYQKHETDNEQESETISQISNNIIDMTLDWTEEVEKNIKLDELDSSTSFSQNLKPSIQLSEVKSKESVVETRESKRSGRSRRRDKRSSSRGNRNSERKDKNRKDSTVSNVSIPEPERNRKDSTVSLQHEAISASLRQKERERRDSHRSNRSSTIGNSRDDLDRWRSLRSYSREQSTEGRIVSQCNSRDASANRALSPRDSDGFRVPSAVPKSGTWTNNQKKSNGTWSGRTPSIERGRHSPAPSVVSTGGEVAGHGGAGGEAREGGRSRRSRRRASRRKHRDTPPPVNQPPGATPAPTNINWRDEILESKKHTVHDKHQENTHQRNRLNSAMSEKSVTESSTCQPGILILPQSSVSHMQKDQGRGGPETQKTLYDHHNPTKPIIVQTSPTKIDTRMERGPKESSSRGGSGYEPGDAARAARHRALLQEVDRADAILQTHTLRGPLALAEHWDDVIETRKFLQNALQRLLMSDLKYCQADNIEHHFWKILYYNFIEILRKSFSQVAPEDKPKIVKVINVIIEEGNTFFENLVQILEKGYKFNTEDYINDNHMLPPKGLGYVGLALISVQKLYVFLGDLARYKEQVNETNNYAKSKFWYTKAQQINPKNGRPYNQLAILAIYARRKLDAVYYYMRSLMSSNPFHSARESLLSLFEENRKKYETAERKRRAALESAQGVNGEAGGSGAGGGGRGPGHSLRREVWVRPSGSRTTTLSTDLRDDHLATMTPVELNKTFITSYLHVHGKLITKIGMETFHESASQMLRQFRALLHRQPLPTPAARLLQLTALNMFAVETTAAALRDGSTGGERSAWLDCALGVSLLMFGAMLERCCALLPEPAHTQQYSDALLLLPAIKAWSDWMLCHSSVWNPPPSFENFETESENDPWDWLAKLMNILEERDDKTIQFENEMKEGYTAVRLSEDASLAGFTPLMYMEPAAAWAPLDVAAPHASEHALRTRKLLFFGTEYLVGVEPPVLRLEYPAAAAPRYVSAVQPPAARHPPLQHLSEDSEDDSASGAASGPTSLGELGEGADEATKKLLRRKEQLENRKATMERRRERMQEILRGGWVSVEVEVRPRWLVPDTNCFIDHLALLQAVAAAPHHAYQLAVPLVVMSELEGLRKCSRVGGSARAALSWVCGGAAPAVRLATSRGSLLASRAFTAEQDGAPATNDDRVLATALNLHANLASEPDTQGEDGADSKCVRRVREVVLLTDDRNLRVKALAADLPARDLPSFVHWAGINTENAQASGIDDSSSRHK